MTPSELDMVSVAFILAELEAFQRRQLGSGDAQKAKFVSRMESLTVFPKASGRHHTTITPQRLSPEVPRVGESAPTV